MVAYTFTVVVTGDVNSHDTSAAFSRGRCAAFTFFSSGAGLVVT